MDFKPQDLLDLSELPAIDGQATTSLPALRFK